MVSCCVPQKFLWQSNIRLNQVSLAVEGQPVDGRKSLFLMFPERHNNLDNN